jgi:hypothetical protein
VRDIGRIQAQREKGGRERSWNGYRHPFERTRQILARHDDRTVAIAHARTVRQQDVAVGEMRVRVKRDGADLVAALERRAIQRFDVAEDVLDLDVAGRHLAAGQAVEHERVVGVRAVSDGNAHGIGLAAVQSSVCWGAGLIGPGSVPHASGRSRARPAAATLHE